MARIILHSRYFKPGTAERKAHLAYLVNYIGTREGVELFERGDWKKAKLTCKQEDMIRQLLKDVPELTDTHEWEDYIANPTRGNASEVISWATEFMADAGKVENYVDYIAQRPRVEKDGKQHGLFGKTDKEIDLAATAKAVSEHPGNVWTNVISLRREDAERLGYNNAEAWKNLVRAKAGEIAAAMRIPYEDFQWYAAFHNERHHPHIHMVAYSTGKEGYLTEKGLERIKSSLANEVFAQDLYQIFAKQTELRNELKQKADRYLALMRELPGEAGNLSELEPFIAAIQKRLPTHGRIQYAYMPSEVKNLVDAVIDRLERNDKIGELYRLWYEQKCAAIATYTLKMPEELPLKDNETFRSIKNAVLRMAQNYRAVSETGNEAGGRGEEPETEEKLVASVHETAPFFEAPCIEEENPEDVWEADEVPENEMDEEENPEGVWEADEVSENEVDEEENPEDVWEVKEVPENEMDREEEGQRFIGDCSMFLRHLARIFETARPSHGMSGAERKLLQEEQRKKETLGLRW